jgi:serine/threonine protein phosphatase PrpC
VAAATQLQAWIDGAMSLSGHQDGAIHAAGGDTLAVAMQQGPRAEQQDCGAALLWIPAFGFSPRCAAVIADGMGGMRGGGWSSRRTVQVVVERCLSGRLDTPRDILASALAAAQEEVLRALHGDGGTTLTAAVWDRDGGMLVHIGDTRAHFVEPGLPFRCLTTDHTDAGHADALDRLATGRPAEPYLPTPPDNRLIDVLGVPDGILAERHVLHTPRGGRCVMTSDGAHDPIRRAGTAAFEEDTGEPRWTARRSVEEIWGRLAQEALSDNATVVAIEPDRALRHADQELRSGDVLLVGPTGVLHHKL